MDLIEALVEVVEQLEFVLRVAVESSDFLNLDLAFNLAVRVGLVEWQHFFFFGFKLPAKFSCLQDSLTESLVLSQRFHALKTVGRQSTKLRVLFIPLISHFSFQVMVMLHNDDLFFLQLIVTVLTFSVILLSLQTPQGSQLVEPIDLSR